MEDALEALTLPGLVICIIIGTIILALLDRRAQRKILEMNKTGAASSDDAPH